MKMHTKASSSARYIRILWVVAMLPWALGLTFILIAMLSGMPKVEDLANPRISLATEIFSSDGHVLGSYYRENRSDVRYADLPGHLVNALLATEDARFKEHSAVDFRALFRAVVRGGSAGGGSTITQQLAKMQFTRDYENVSIIRRAWQKVREIIIAARLERYYTKDEIVALYLNQYDFLNQAVGIKSAAHVYFNTTPDSLNVQQSAMLVGMLKNSSLFNPLKRDSLVMKRREVVLAQMVKYKYLSENEYDSLRVLPLGLDFQRVSHDEGLAPYFREVLRSEIDKILHEKNEDGQYIRLRSDGNPYDLYTDGLRVITTLDTRMQRYAEWAVEEHLSRSLQKEFTRDVGRRKQDKYPFYNGIAEKDREKIMNKAVRSSERYLQLSGSLCPECRRPEHYIRREAEGDRHFFVCNAEKGGCGHRWEDVGEEGIIENFNTPVSMRVYAHGGYRDTLMSPLDSIKYHKAVLHASLMSVDPHTGHIKAWVGGIDYKYFKFDNAFQSHRQVGSTFKPLIYATALRNNDKPCSRYPNEKICIDLPTGAKWCPDNSEGEYGGNYSLTKALAHSVNTISAKLISKYSPDAVISLGKNLGIKSTIPNVPSIALGVAELTLYEMVGANAAFVNNGVYIEPTFLLRIEDKNGNAIYEADPEIKQALDPTVAFELVKMMKAVVSEGTGQRLRRNVAYGNLTQPIAGKTGTTQNNTDGWFMGLTPDLVTGVWVGAQDPTVRFSSTLLGQGANTGLPIFGYYMNKVYGDKSLKVSTADFAPPDNYDAERFKCTGEVELFSEEDEDLFGEEEIPNGELGFDSDSILPDSLRRNP